MILKKKINQIFISFNKMFFPVFLFTIKKAVPVTETHFEIIHKFMYIEYVMPGFSKTPSFQKSVFFHQKPGFLKHIHHMHLF